MTWHRGPLSFMRNCKGSTSPGVAISAVQSKYVKRSCASLGLDRDLLGTLYQEAYEDQNAAKPVQCACPVPTEISKPKELRVARSSQSLTPCQGCKVPNTSLQDCKL